jgi:hypothetical protein
VLGLHLVIAGRRFDSERGPRHGYGPPLVQPLRDRRAGDRRIREHGDLRVAVMQLVGIAGDDRDGEPAGNQRAFLVEVLAECTGTHDESDVVLAEHGAQPGLAARQVTGELRMILREPGPGPECLLPHG